MFNLFTKSVAALVALQAAASLATPVMHQPLDVGVEADVNITDVDIAKRATGYANSVYFVQWSVFV